MVVEVRRGAPLPDRSGQRGGADASLSVDDVAFAVVPHTHWDREWYLPFEQFRVLLVRTVEEILDTLEADPRFSHFTLDGQAAIVDDVLELRPDLEPRVAALARAGRLAVGPAYVLPDEFLIGAETHVRNLILGGRVVRRLGAEPMGIGYQPDPFGHIAAMPQILRGFGLDGFVFWRGMGDEVDRLGPIFRWVGPDGSWVHAIRQLDGYGAGCDFGRWIENGVSVHEQPERWPEAAAHRFVRFVRKQRPTIERGELREISLANGGDHRRIQPDLPALLDAARDAHPRTSIAIDRYDTYLDRVRGRLGDIAEVSGELLGAREAFILRGVNSARMYLKQRHAEIERDLIVGETLASLALLSRGASYPAAELWHAWRELLRNSPHDSITGCSVDGVHADMLDRYRRAGQITERVRREALAALVGRDEPWTHEPAAEADRSVVNPLPMARTVAVSVPVPASLADVRSLVLDRAEGVMPVQLTSDGRGLAVVDLPAFGAATFTLRPWSWGRGAGDAVAAGGRTIETDRLRVRVTDGAFEVTDLVTGAVHRRVAWLEDVGDRGDEYTFRGFDEPARTTLGMDPAVRVLADGPLVAEIEAAYTLSLPEGLATEDERSDTFVSVRVAVRARLVRGLDRVEFTVVVDNVARDHRLRVRVDDETAASSVRAEGHFAVLRRAPGRRSEGTGWYEVPEATDHTAGFVAAGSVALVGRGLPEYEAVRRPDGGLDLALTLLRCVGQLGRDLPSRSGGAGPAIATPDAQCQGRRVSEFALLLGAGERTDGDLVRASLDYRIGAEIGPAGPHAAVPIVLTGGPVAFSALKAAEDGDGVILRIWNPDPELTFIDITSPGRTIERCRLDETWLDAPGRDPMTIGPSEVATYRIRPLD
jgi:mannosylglycerate hydrolase